MSPPLAAVVLAGGRSARMGADKASLAWGGETLLSRTVASLATVVERVVVVRSAGQELPPLPPAVRIVEDARPGRGPLEGIASGLRALERDALAFVCAVDMPFLEGAFAAAVMAALPDGADAAVPRAGGRVHPMAAAYRAGVLGTVDAHLAAGRMSMRELLDALEVRWLDDLPGAERALRNLNTPAELTAARQESGEKGTTDPAHPSSSSPTQATAVAPAREVTA